MAKKPGKITEESARRVAAAIEWVEAERRKKRIPVVSLPMRGRGFFEVGAAKLQENLDAGNHATAKLLIQNATTGAWTESTDSGDEFEVYDSFDFLSSADSEYLASGCKVIFWRNPATGFRNVIGSPCCPSTA